MTEQQFERVVQAVKWLMGGLAVVAAFLLVQDDIVVTPAVKVALGAFLAFAAYLNPASIVTRARGEGNAP